jgi:hypothetical protein
VAHTEAVAGANGDGSHDAEPHYPPAPGPEDLWGDYSTAAAYLDGWDLASEIERTKRDDVCRMRFVQLPQTRWRTTKPITANG